jgi:hypothetical protein
VGVGCWVLGVGGEGGGGGDEAHRVPVGMRRRQGEISARAIFMALSLSTGATC